MPRVTLPTPVPLSVSLDLLLLSRRSTRKYTSEAIPLEVFSTILYWGFGKLGERLEHGHSAQRPHPSGGAKYPTELYPLVLNVEGIESGVYHYNVPNHVLEKLPQELNRSILDAAYRRYTFVPEAGALLCLSALRGRQIREYGALSYKLELIEAGHVGQNLYLAAHAAGLGCCGLGAGDTSAMHEMLGLDGGNEHLVYSIVVGKRA